MQLAVLPSLPPASFIELEGLANILAGTIDEFQVDIVDGVFVSAKSWPFTESADVHNELSKLKLLPPSIQLELDCMVLKPEQYLATFISLGVKRVIIHFGSTSAFDEIVLHAQTHKYALGLAFTNDIELSKLESYIPKFDFVQVMGIERVGVQGAPFDERTISTVASIRAKYPSLSICVDGAVNAQTILALKNAGADRFAPGSAITKAIDPVLAYKQLCALVGI